jgi:ATP-binding cassette subfamily B protein
MSRSLENMLWPLDRLGESIEALAHQHRYALRAVETPRPPEDLCGASESRLGAWIEAAADELGIEAEAVEAPLAEVASLLWAVGPAIVFQPGSEPPRFLAVVRGARRSVELLGPRGFSRCFPVEEVAALLCASVEAPLGPGVDALLESAGIPPRRRARARAALLRERLRKTPLRGAWLLREQPGASFWRRMVHSRLHRYLLAFVAAHAVYYGLYFGSWWMIGEGALSGHLDEGWLWAWALLLFTMVPFSLLATWAQGRLSIGVGSLLKQRLLHGVMRLEPDEIRHQGAGQFLGRVIESEAVESMALSAGFQGLIAFLEIVLAVSVLALGAGGALHVVLLLVWVAVTGSLGWRYFLRRRRWTEARVAMTNDLVERMVGHRTRIAQELRERWHDGEDQALERYISLSTAMDRTVALMGALLPRGWLALGILGMAPAFVSGSATPGALAVGLGGVLLAGRAFSRLMQGIASVSGAAIVWEQVAPIFRAAARAQAPGLPAFALATPGRWRRAAPAQPILEGHDLVFRYRQRGEAVLRGLSLQVREGDRILLEGPSGGGKSTLASLLVGLREPESGLLLLGGVDRKTLGPEGWRRRVVAAPQFHENHVLCETFSFNLLMGRGWPPHPDDIQEAEEVCRELNLGDLLARMPAGLQQMVGESGWRLSHGERSRLFIARALLQRAEVVILDESFAALDLETLEKSLRCVLKRAPTLLVIAHP